MPTHSQTLKRCKRLEAYAGVVDEIVEPLGKEACNGPCKVVYCCPDAEVESKSDKAVAGVFLQQRLDGSTFGRFSRGADD